MYLIPSTRLGQPRILYMLALANEKLLKPNASALVQIDLRVLAFHIVRARVYSTYTSIGLLHQI